MTELAKQDRWMTIAESSEYIGVSRATLYSYMGDGRLRFFYIKGSNQRRIKRSDLDALFVPGNREDINEDKDSEV